ncbi:MAG: hypothetical protein HY040_17830 [Planctomycetes bacterium]|nr:hypothetical protein [Planctomycetota bacterium]
MGKLFNLGVVLVLALVGLCGYWYLNPHHAPNFVRDTLPGLQLPSPRSPMTNFRPPQF